MVEQSLHVTFNLNGCFVEDVKNQGKLIIRGERNGRMFILDVNMHEVNSMLFTRGKGARDIEIWHKRVGHVNLQHFKVDGETKSCWRSFQIWNRRGDVKSL